MLKSVSLIAYEYDSRPWTVEKLLRLLKQVWTGYIFPYKILSGLSYTIKISKENSLERKFSRMSTSWVVSMASHLAIYKIGHRKLSSVQKKCSKIPTKEKINDRK